jgi:hypothetical protein
MDTPADLAAAVRALIAATVTADAPPEAIARARTAVAAAVAALQPHVPSPVPPRYPTGGFDPMDPATLMPYDPVMGPRSPLAPPIRFAWEEPKAVGRVTFGTPYEGPPGCVHGGVIAGAFDQVFNVVNVLRGAAGPTARLDVRYRRPTPLHTEVRFEGWQTGVEGRHVRTAGRLVAGDEVTVEAEGVFVLVPIERVLQLLGRKEEP